MDAMSLTVSALNLAALVCLWASLVWLIVKHKADISEEARKLFFQPLLLGLTFWVIERVAIIIPLSYAYYRNFSSDTLETTALYKTCLVIGLIASAPSDISRFIAGRNLFRLQHRLMHDVQPVMPDPPIWLKVKAAICSRTALMGAYVLAIAPVVLSPLWLSGAIREVFINRITYSSAGYGFLVLGTSLTRELTRHRREFVGLFTGLSVVFYGVIQFCAGNKEWIPYLNVLAFTLKAMFGVAIASFWTMSRELTRANEELPTVKVFRTRFFMDIHDALQAPDAILKFSDTAMTFFKKGNIEEVSRCMGSINEIARMQNEQLREILRSLQAGTDVVTMGLIASIQKLADNPSNGQAVMVQIAGDESVLTPVQRENVYLVAREALRNALRHAANSTLVKIILDCNRKILTIEDNGEDTLAVVEPRRGSGISMMRASAVEIGASLNFEKCQPSGTRVRLEIQGEQKPTN